MVFRYDYREFNIQGDAFFYHHPSAVNFSHASSRMLSFESPESLAVPCRRNQIPVFTITSVFNSAPALKESRSQAIRKAAQANPFLEERFSLSRCWQVVTGLLDKVESLLYCLQVSMGKFSNSPTFTLEVKISNLWDHQKEGPIIRPRLQPPQNGTTCPSENFKSHSSGIEGKHASQLAPSKDPIHSSPPLDMIKFPGVEVRLLQSTSFCSSLKSCFWESSSLQKQA